MKEGLKINDEVLIREHENRNQIVTIVGHTKHFWVCLIPENHIIFPNNTGIFVTHNVCKEWNVDKVYIGKYVWQMSDQWIEKLVRRPKIRCKACQK